MPHVISRTQIPEKIRQPHEARYRRQLREALLNPALSAEQRADVKARLARVGRSRVYRSDSPPPPGAIDPGTPNVAPPASVGRYPSEAALLRLTKPDLLGVGMGEGAEVSASQTKAVAASIITANRVTRGWL